MHRFSKRFLSATLRSSCTRQRDAAAAISFSDSVPIGESIDDSRKLKLLSSIQSLGASGMRTMHSQTKYNTLWRSILPYISQGSSSRREWLSFGICQSFCHGRESDPLLDRNFLARLWIAEKKMERAREKRQRKRKVVKYRNDLDNAYDNQSFFQNPTGRLFSRTAAAGENHYERGKPTVKQPPVSQSMSGYLEPTSPEEAQVAPLLARSNLLITRDIEWANLVLGFEQENRYAVVDVCYPQAPAGFIREQSNVIARQLLRLRRPFFASITDALGNELFRVRRPFWWITSSIYAEINGKEIGVVHRRWHLWRRIYDLYLGNKQFAVVENPGFWNWTFTMKDIGGEVLAQIDRDWRGFGFEIFTDAGQYVIRFGKSDATSKTGAAAMIEELEVKRPLSLSERAIAVALAISLDNDYFSRHGGWGIPFIAVEE